MDHIESIIQIALEDALLLEDEVIPDTARLRSTLDSDESYDCYIIFEVGKALGVHFVRSDVAHLFEGDPTIGSIKKGLKEAYQKAFVH